MNQLDHVISPQHLEIAMHTADSIKSLKASTNTTKLRAFLEPCNVFRRFVPNCARIETPLKNKGEDQSAEKFWSSDSWEAACAAQASRKKLVSPPTLVLPNGRGKYILNNDACNVQVRCVPLQKQPDGTTKPDEYWSRSLPKAEQSYDTTQREYLAIVWSVLMLRPYLAGTHFKIRTNHD